MGTRTDVIGLLRREVTDLRARESRRVFDPVLYVGTLGGDRDSVVVRARDLPAIDRAVRVDVVDALLGRVGGHARSAWLTRPGAPDLLDTDAEWMNAARAGFAMHDRTLSGFWVVTPRGFCDAATGEAQSVRASPRPRGSRG